eukprot:CFRG5061T1
MKAEIIGFLGGAAAGTGAFVALRTSKWNEALETKNILSSVRSTLLTNTGPTITNQKKVLPQSTEWDNAKDHWNQLVYKVHHRLIFDETPFFKNTRDLFTALMK